MSRRTLAALAAAIFGALLLLAPGGASAHPGHVHAAAPKNVTAPVAAKSGADATPSTAPRAELKAQAPAVMQGGPDSGCGDRGCCNSGHCSACAHALAPVAWAAFGSPEGVRLRNPDTAPPPALAREGPPRPPKFLA